MSSVPWLLGLPLKVRFSPHFPQHHPAALCPFSGTPSSVAQGFAGEQAGDEAHPAQRTHSSHGNLPQQCHFPWALNPPCYSHTSVQSMQRFKILPMSLINSAGEGSALQHFLILQAAGVAQCSEQGCSSPGRAGTGHSPAQNSQCWHEEFRKGAGSSVEL